MVVVNVFPSTLILLRRRALFLSQYFVPRERERPGPVVDPTQIPRNLAGDVGLASPGQTDHDHQQLSSLAVTLVQQVGLGRQISASRTGHRF